MMERLFFRLRSFKLSEDLDIFKVAEKIGDKIVIDSLFYFPRLTNNKGIIDRYFSSEKFIYHIGNHK